MLGADDACLRMAECVALEGLLRPPSTRSTIFSDTSVVSTSSRRPSISELDVAQKYAQGLVDVHAPPLVQAIQQHRIEDVWQLIERSAGGGPVCLSCEMRDGKMNATPLAWAAYHDDLDSLRCLIEARADLEASNKNGCTAMSLASGSGHATCVRALIEAKANVNSINAFGHSPLTLAATYGKPDCVALLVEAGADRYHRHKEGLTALELARKSLDAEVSLHGLTVDVFSGRAEGAAMVIDLLEAADADGKECMRELTELIKRCDVHAIYRMLEEGPRGLLVLEQRDRYGNPPLAIAAWKGCVGAVELLLSARALVNNRNGEGSTALAVAARYNRAQCCRVLLRAGADRGIVDAKGRTPLEVVREYTYVQRSSYHNFETVVSILEGRDEPPPAIASGGRGGDGFARAPSYLHGGVFPPDESGSNDESGTSARSSSSSSTPRKCSICLDKPLTHAFVPCGHLTVCKDCANQCMTQSKNCPLCRSPCLMAMQVYHQGAE